MYKAWGQLEFLGEFVYPEEVSQIGDTCRHLEKAELILNEPRYQSKYKRFSLSG